MWPGADALALRLRWPHARISHKDGEGAQQGRGGEGRGGREGKEGKEGGQRYKPDQPFSSFAHKYLCG